MDRRQAGPGEVEYSAVDFSRWNRNPPADRKDERQATETEYAELQKEACREETAGGVVDIRDEVELQVEEVEVVVEVGGEDRE